MARTKARSETDIEVNVIDESGLEEELSNNEEAIEQLNEEKDKTVIGLKTHLNHGWIEPEDEDGVFVIDNEAIFYEDPVTEDEPLIVDIFPVFEKNEDGSRPMAMMPCGQIKLDDEDIRELNTEGTQNLEEFVREFGNRIEHNYEQAVDMLEDRVQTE